MSGQSRKAIKPILFCSAIQFLPSAASCGLPSRHSSELLSPYFRAQKHCRDPLHPHPHCHQELGQPPGQKFHMACRKIPHKYKIKIVVKKTFQWSEKKRFRLAEDPKRLNL